MDFRREAVAFRVAVAEGRGGVSITTYELSLPQTFGVLGAFKSFHHSLPLTRNLYS
jgi:hypothetical protein